VVLSHATFEAGAVPFIDFVCLANSYKLKGRCVAGLTITRGRWIRLVSARPFGVIDTADFKMATGIEPRVLDVIRVRVLKGEPQRHQPENWLVGEEPWQLVERPARQRAARILAAALHGNELIFGNDQATVPLETFETTPATESLLLVKPSDVVWRTDSREGEDRSRTRIRFRAGTITYDLPLTDPKYLAAAKWLPSGEHQSSELGIPDNRKLLFALSLSEPYHGAYYKLIAAIVLLPHSWQSLFGD
jgi:hypothetical protein